MFNTTYKVTLVTSFGFLIAHYLLVLTDITTALCVIFMASREEVKETTNQCFKRKLLRNFVSYWPFKLYMYEPITCYCVYYNHPQSMNGKGNKFIKADTLIYPVTA